MDGQPKLLTEDIIYERVVEWTRDKEAGDVAAEKRKEGLKTYKKAREEWETVERMRKRTNEGILEAYNKLLKEWEAERVNAKQDHRRTGWNKPVKPTTTKGDPPLLKAMPMPKQADFGARKGKERAVDGDDDEDQAEGNGPDDGGLDSESEDDE